MTRLAPAFLLVLAAQAGDPVITGPAISVHPGIMGSYSLDNSPCQSITYVAGIDRYVSLYGVRDADGNRLLYGALIHPETGAVGAPSLLVTAPVDDYSIAVG